MVNLERSITITGDHGNFQETGQGWHGGAFLDTKAALHPKVFLHSFDQIHVRNFSQESGLIEASNSTFSGEVCEFAPAGSIEVTSLIFL